MTNPTAGYSYNICVNDNDFGGACMKRLRFTADMTKEQKRNTVEAALLLGFQAETAVFPVAAADGEIPVPETKEEFRKLWKKTADAAPRGMRRLRTTSGRFTTWISGKKQDWKKCSKKVRF